MPTAAAKAGGGGGVAMEGGKRATPQTKERGWPASPRWPPPTPDRRAMDGEHPNGATGHGIDAKTGCLTETV
jgi:hypothetical protein